ncbi:hypothetical protein [Ectopseudomonas guguanensis]|jgi:hypothetical protein|uniref:Uncharacterized protein n=2 Tax=Ectopseudomonas TaxID=3236654 RepID=A0A1H0KL49_9GAMM|nr:hypothetical protein [Pseudomonas guguanensis]SDO56490.1 hypothetical protein SAMN05216213_101321 [Pseudomonas guguanensis]
MPYLYHATNKANLVGIRDVGMAPASRRPASRALGATQQNRIDKRENKRLASFKKFLKKLAEQGYAHHTILQSTVRVRIAFSNRDFAEVEEIPYAPGAAIPENKGLIAADADLEEILAAYIGALRHARVPFDDDLMDERQARLDARAKLTNKKQKPLFKDLPNLNKLARAKLLLDNEYRRIDTLDLSRYYSHFLSELSYAYQELVADNEQEITRHRVYLFAENQFRTEYASYATHIANGQYEALAILRVDLAHVVNPMVDMSQGNAATTKETINAAHIQYKIGVTQASVQNGSAFRDGWSELSGYVPPTATLASSMASSSQGNGLDGGTI